MEDSSRRLEKSPRRNDYRRYDDVSRNADSIQETVANTVVEAFARYGDVSDKSKDPPPVWEKSISFAGWRRSVEIWSETSLKPAKKANLLLENLKKDTEHSGLKELIIQEVIENEEFDYRNENVVKNILDKIEAFVEESKWTKNVRIAREFMDFKQEASEDMLKYVVRFSALEAKLKNEKILMSNMFKTGVLLNQSKIGHLEKSNIMASIDMNNEEEVLEKVKKKIRENYEVNKDAKETFVSVNEVVKEPNETLYGNNYGSSRNRNESYRNEDRNKSRERDRGRSRDRGFQRDGKPHFQRNRSYSNFKSKSRDRRNGRSNSRGIKPQGDGNSQDNIKRTYKVEKLNIDIEKSVFENEIENRMLIDSGCPEMVCGQTWLKTYESSCGKTFRSVGKEDFFRLGNETFKTVKTVRIPFNIGALKEEIDVGVVEANIPMLLSKSKLKEWGAKIDFLDNTMYIRKTKETIKLKETKQGHLTFPMAKNIKDNVDELVKHIHIVRMKKKYGMKELKKIHRVFGHPTTEKVAKLLKDAGEDDPVIMKILRRIHDHCADCKKHQKNASKPKVGLPKAREVNETVCLDLKPVSTLINKEDRRQIVYMVDSFSNFTAAGISKSKEAEAVAEVVLKKWCLFKGGLGYPSRSFFCDNGTEFRKEFLEEISRKLNVKINLTPSYSPWSNGGCERRHGAIDLTIKKMMDDDCDLKLEDALDHALWARNLEIGRHGLSPYQVVFGKSPVLPGISEGTPMSDSLVTEADAVRLHFQRQEIARAELRKYDSNRRLKDALKSRIQPYFDAKYEAGDLVIYQDANDQWTGPAEVKVMDSKTLFVIHNGQMKKVASCRARPWVDSENEITDTDTDSESELSVDESRNSSCGLERESSNRLETEESIALEPEASCRMENELGENKERRPKRGSQITFQKVGETSQKTGKVKHVGKSGSKKKNTCWIENGDEVIELDFLKDVSGWKYEKEAEGVKFQETMSYDEQGVSSRRLENEMEAEGVFYLTRNNQPKEVFATVIPVSQYKNPEVQAAMNDELEKWVAFEAYEIVNDEGQERIDTRWNILGKERHDGLKKDFKARLCLRGFKEFDKPRSDSPTVDRISNKILYTIAGNEGWDIQCIDVTSAFLQGEDLDRKLYVTPPKEANMPGMLWLMKKAAYGLYDAGRRWWIKFILVLKELGGQTLVGDESFLFFHKDGKLVGLIALHVDDFQGAGTPQFFVDVLDQICSKFKISKREKGSFKYTGVNVRKESDGIVIDQKDYFESLEEIEIDPKDDNKRSLNKEEYKKFRGVTGKLNWLSEMTRPDLSYDCLNLSCHTKNATVADMKEANKAIKKAKANPGEIRYGRVGNFENLKILGISDASYLKQEERTKSVMGRMIFLSSLQEDRVAPIVWKAKTIPTVCKTVKDAETRAADKCVEDAIYIARCVKEIYSGVRGQDQIKVDICTDSQSLIDSIDSTRQIDSKLLRPIVKFMKQMLDSQMVNTMRWVDTNVCVADILTKPGRGLLTNQVMEIMRTGNMIDLNWTNKKSKIL